MFREIEVKIESAVLCTVGTVLAIGYLLGPLKPAWNLYKKCN